MSAALLTERIRSMLKHYDVVGIASRDRFDYAPVEFHPDHLLNGFQSAIVFGQGNSGVMNETGGFTDIFGGLAAQGDVLDCLKSEGYRTVNLRGTERNVSLVQMAIQAGLGEMSPVNSLVVKGYGLAVSLAAILTDAILLADDIATDVCIKCMACMNDCPATEIPYKRDTRKCGCGKCRDICPV